MLKEEVSAMGLLIETFFQSSQLRMPGLVYSMYAGCHFSSAKLFYAKPEYPVVLICMVSSLFLR